MNSNELLQLFAVVSGFVGSYLVIKRKVSAFYWWLASNAALMVIQYVLGAYMLIALYAAYSVMNVYGICEWRKGARQGQPPTADTVIGPGI